jgi:hypothetical protein
VFFPTILRRAAVVLPLLVTATALPVITPEQTPKVRHFALPLKGASAVRAPGDFSLIGVALPSSADAPQGARVRTSLDGKRWGKWFEVEFDADVGPDRDSDEAGSQTSMPVWTGRNRFVDVSFPNGTPAGATVHAVDPGPDPSMPASAAIASPSKPGIITRAQWGADESIRRDNPDYAEPLRMAIVHHTATADSYAKSESDNIVRSIYAYHVKTNGWDDIGYNFLVDRYGQIFEGRYGGVNRAVIGAHAQGFNSHSAGISIIGNFMSSKPPEVAMSSLKRIVSWRLDQATVDPGSSLTYISNGSNKYPEGQAVTLRTVSAHRDVGQTACPGNPLYGALGWLRSAAKADGLPKVFNMRLSRGAITPNGDGVADSVKLAANLNPAVNWRVDVLNSSGTSVWKLTGTGTSLGINWYGKGSSGALVPHGSYRFKVTGKNSRGSLRAYYAPFSVYRWPNGTLLYTSSKVTYIIEKNKLRHPWHWQARASRYLSSEIVNVPNSIIHRYAVASRIGFREGSLLSADGKVYIISEAKKRPTSRSTLAARGFNTNGIVATTAEAVALHATGSTFGRSSPYPNGAALRSSTGGEAWMLGGVARPFITSNVRRSHLIRTAEMAIADGAVAGGATSARLGFREGTLIRQSGTSGIYIVSDGKRRGFTSSTTFNRMGYKWENVRMVSAAELALHPMGSSL